MCSLDDIVEVAQLLYLLPGAVFLSVRGSLASQINRPISRVKKLQENMDKLTTKYERLCDMEANIRFCLRRDEGYRMKVKNKFTITVWLDRVEVIKSKLNGLRRAIEEHPRCVFHSYSRFKLATRVGKLLVEVQFLLERVLYVLDYDRNLPPMNAAVFSSRIVGEATHKVLDEIWECLLDPSIGTVGIYGLGGVGKSTAMRNIADQLGKSDVFDKIVWVNVCKNGYTNRVDAEVAMQLGITIQEYTFPALNQNQNRKILSEKMKNLKKHLFVLDDMWAYMSLSDSGPIPKPTKENGCKIVVISRFSEVCTKMKADKLINLAPLSEEEAWGLFINKASDSVLDPDIESIAKQIVNECSGLPMSIIAVGHAMRDAHTIDDWRLALADIRSFDELDSQTCRDFKYGICQTASCKGDISNLLRFAYGRLKNDTVRRCFLYCAFFPVGYRFNSKQLIGYWMAEEFIHTEDGFVTSINEGHEIVRELKDANMLEMFTERGNEWYSVPDLYRDLAICTMGFEKPPLLVRAGVGLLECPQHWEWVRARQISLIRNQIEILPGIDQVCPHLTTLLLQGNPISHISPSFFDQMPLLEFLDLSCTRIIGLPPSLVELSKLRVLFLQYCTSLRSIPSLEKLKELQVLNLSGTLIKELPQGMKGLHSLRSLDLSETIRLQKMEAGTIAALSNLLELRMQGSRLCMMGSEQEGNRFKELRCLNHLEILTLSAVGFDDHLDIILYLQGRSLKKISVNVYGSAEDCVEDVEES